jgi:hypothetical protein
MTARQKATRKKLGLISTAAGEVSHFLTRFILYLLECKNDMVVQKKKRQMKTE